MNTQPLLTLRANAAAEGDTALVELINAVLSTGITAVTTTGDWALRCKITTAYKACLPATPAKAPRARRASAKRGASTAHPWAHDEE